MIRTKSNQLDFLLSQFGKGSNVSQRHPQFINGIDSIMPFDRVPLHSGHRLDGVEAPLGARRTSWSRFPSCKGFAKSRYLLLLISLSWLISKALCCDTFGGSTEIVVQKRGNVVTDLIQAHSKREVESRTRRLLVWIYPNRGWGAAPQPSVAPPNGRGPVRATPGLPDGFRRGDTH